LMLKHFESSDLYVSGPTNEGGGQKTKLEKGMHYHGEGGEIREGGGGEG